MLRGMAVSGARRRPQRNQSGNRDTDVYGNINVEINREYSPVYLILLMSVMISLSD